MVGSEAAPVLVLDDAGVDADADADVAEADALLELSESVVPFAFPALVRAVAVTPVLFLQSALYSSVDSEAWVNVMSAH